MFEKAARLKLRFNSSKGQLSIEELWDLPLTSQTGKANLDDIARDLHSQLKNDSEVSFVHKDRKSDPAAQLAFDIVKHVIEVRLAENEQALAAKTNAEKKQQLMALITQKENAQLQDMPLEDLKKMVEAL